MESKAHWNPVFAWLTRNTRWPSARATLGLAAGLMLVSLTLIVFLVTRVEEYPLNTILRTASWGLHLVMPLVAAPVANILTVRETEDEGFQLLRVTPGYSPGGAVRGLVWAALYRLRVLLVLMVALAPMVIVESYRSDKQLARDRCYEFVSREEWSEIDWDSDPDPDACIEPSDGRLLLGALMILLWPVGLWGVTLLSAALAVWLALWWGREGWVWVISIGGLLCALLSILCVFVLTLLGPIIASNFSSIVTYTYTPRVANRWPPPGLEVALVFSVVFYVLAWGVMRLARRWA